MRQILLTIPVWFVPVYFWFVWPVSASEIFVSVPERIAQAKLVVVGTLRTNGNHRVIDVQETFRGKSGKHIPVKYQPRGQSAERVVYMESWNNSPRIDIYYLREHTILWDLVHMIKDPAPYIDLTKYPEHPDMIMILGHLFSSLKITRKDEPSVEFPLYDYYSCRYFPWQVRDVHEICCRCSSNQWGTSLKFVSIKPTTSYDERIAEFVETGLMSREYPLIWESTLIVDGRVPQKISSLSAGKAISYLRDRLTSPDPEIVQAALVALAKIRDLDSLPAVVRLLKSPDCRIQVCAVAFMRYAADDSVLAPLCDLLDKHAQDYPKNFELSDEICQALRLIANKKAKSHLERAATHGVGRAGEVLCDLGDKASFQVLVNTRYDKFPYQHGNCLYWLVLRSNKKLKDWMKAPGAKFTEEELQRWKAWWEENHGSFEIVRSFKEAVRLRMESESH